MVVKPSFLNKAVLASKSLNAEMDALKGLLDTYRSGQLQESAI